MDPSNSDSDFDWIWDYYLLDGDIPVKDLLHGAEDPRRNNTDPGIDSWLEYAIPDKDVPHGAEDPRRNYTDSVTIFSEQGNGESIRSLGLGTDPSSNWTGAGSMFSHESEPEDSFNDNASVASYSSDITDSSMSSYNLMMSLSCGIEEDDIARKAEVRKRNPLILTKRPVIRGITVCGSSSENPQKKRKRASVDSRTLRQGKKILMDRTDRLIKNFEATSSRLKLLCMQTCPENRNLLSQVNLVASPLESDLQTIKNDIKYIFERGKGGQGTDEKNSERFKETELKLDIATVKHSEFNSQVEKLETLLKSDTVDYKDLKKKLHFEFPKIFTGETAMVGGQVEATTPNIPVILQSIATAGEIQKARGMDTGLADNTIPIEDGMKLVLDWKKEQLGPLECEATLEKAKEAGFLEEKDAETSLKNILSIYFAFKMKQK